MSFILDALKKSELERQRQATPGLMDAPPAAPRARFPLWAVALCALLGINIIVVLAFVLTRGSAPAARPAAGASRAASASPAPVASQVSPPATPPVAESRPDHFSPMDPASTYAPEVPPTGAAPTEIAPLDSPHAHANRLGAADEAPRPAAHPADPILTHEDGAADAEVLPSINEVNLNGQVAEMHLDVHVYATHPADRFVYVNMRRYREGETLAEGPVVERIRRDGVVLDYRGVRFLLPRQQ
jgi:general secretion pathway protein B